MPSRFGLKGYVLLWLLCVVMFPASAFNAQTNLLQPQQAQQSLPYLYYQPAVSNISLNQLLAEPAWHHAFKLLPENHRPLFREQQAMWFFMRLKNPGDKTITLILNYPFPLTDKIEVYQVNHNFQDAQLLNRAGTDYPFNERQLPAHSYALSLQLAPLQELNIYLKIHDTAVIPSDIRLWHYHSFLAEQQWQTTLDGLLSGMLLILCLLCIRRFIQQQHICYVYCAGFLLSYGLALSCLNGQGFALLWPTHPEINHAMLYLFTGSLILHFNLFIYATLHSSVNSLWQKVGFINNMLALALLFSPLYASGEIRLFILLAVVGWQLCCTALLLFSTGWRWQHSTFSQLALFMLLSTLALLLSQTRYLDNNADWLYSLLPWVIAGLAWYLSDTGTNSSARHER